MQKVSDIHVRSAKGDDWHWIGEDETMTLNNHAHKGGFWVKAETAKKAREAWKSGRWVWLRDLDEIVRNYG